VAEVLEGSVMLASQALLMAGIPLSRVVRRVQEARAKRYSMFSGFLRGAQAEVGDETEALQPRFHHVMLSEHDRAVGKRLGDMKLGELTVEVNGVRRHQVHGSDPSPDMLLRSGDVLMLLGQPLMLEAAEKRLRKG
jgi:CPA2 family monovalent cation:H+ antiporter-2